MPPYGQITHTLLYAYVTYVSKSEELAPDKEMCTTTCKILGELGATLQGYSGSLLYPLSPAELFLIFFIH